MAYLGPSQQRVKRVAIQCFREGIHLDQQLEFVACVQQLSVGHLDFAAHTFHQDHHRAEAQQNLKQQIEDGGVLQVAQRNIYSPEALACSKHRHVMQKSDREQQ